MIFPSMSNMITHLNLTRNGRKFHINMSDNVELIFEDYCHYVNGYGRWLMLLLNSVFVYDIYYEFFYVWMAINAESIFATYIYFYLC